MQRSFVFLLVLVVLSCNKAFESKWDIDVVTPLFQAEIDLKDLIPDSLTQINSDQSISLIIESDELKLNLDTLATIQEVSTVEKFLSPFISLTIPPNGTFPTPFEETEIEFGDVELKQVRIKSGKLGLAINSYVEEDMIGTFTVVSSNLNGSAFSVEETIPAGSANIPGSFYKEYDISGYELDLTGEDGNLFNTIVSDLNVIVDPNGSTVTVNNQDTLIVEVFYLDVQTEYATGFFGSEIIELENETVDLTLINGINPGAINFENVTLDLKLINGIGADFRFRIENIESINSEFNSSVTLNHNIIGNTINLDRAIDFPSFIPFEESYILDNSNSNIRDWIENFPNRIQYSVEAELNPLGNVSGGNDFIYCDSELGIEINTEIPLCFSAESLSLEDTVSYDLAGDANIDNIRSGNLELLIENGFPLEGNIQIHIYDGMSIVDSLLENTFINASSGSSFSTGQSVNSNLIVPVIQEKFEKLKDAEHLIIKATLNSPDFNSVKLFSEQSIQMTAIFNGNYLIDNE
ncbi:MAG: hypothetical protein AAF487_10515 [Bacteroidota bacterium]